MVCESVPWGVFRKSACYWQACGKNISFRKAAPRMDALGKLCCWHSRDPFFTTISTNPEFICFWSWETSLLFCRQATFRQMGLDWKVCTKDLLKLWQYVPSLSDVGLGEFNGIPQGDIDKMNGRMNVGSLFHVQNFISSPWRFECLSKKRLQNWLLESSRALTLHFDLAVLTSPRVGKQETA